MTNLQISTQGTSPATSSTGPFRDQFLDRVQFGTINVNAGTLAVAAGRDVSSSHAVQPTRPATTVVGLTTGPFLVTQPTNKTTWVKNLNIAGGATPTATLDLNDNDMVVDYTSTDPFSTIRSQIKNAYNSGAWTGTGITSGAARATASSAHTTALGYARSTDVSVGGGVFSGVGDTAAGSVINTSTTGTFTPLAVSPNPVDNTSVLVRYTWAGDANLDGSVDSVDFNILAANFAIGVGDWAQADFNYDGFVDTTDFNLLVSNFAQPTINGSAVGSSLVNGTNPGSIGAIGALVPEPTSLSLVGLAAAGLMARRRRARN